jgi:tartrate dehydratase alpha subunit/fumarate hydratase class I-like protein
MQPILDVTRGSITTSAHPDFMNAVNEIQNRLQRKADSETVDQLVRNITHAKEVRNFVILISFFNWKVKVGDECRF